MTRRVAVVTGANRGIGYEIARQLAAFGVDVIATSRDAVQGQATAQELGVGYAPLDVTNGATIEALAERLRGGLDILVNNAGISMRGFDASVARRTLDVNFFGAMAVTERLLPRMRPSGRIVMVSSGAGELASMSASRRAKFLDAELTKGEVVLLMESFVRDVAAGVHAKRGWPTSAYAVSKGGLNALTRVLARELRRDPRRILVNAASPGWVRTAMGGAGAPRSPEQGARTPVWLALLPDDGPTGGFFEEHHEIPW